MIKIHYPKNIEQLKANYLKLFDLPEMERRWKPVKKAHGIELTDLLIGDFNSLVDTYYWYKGQPVTERQEAIYEDIFDYDRMQPRIAAFFMDKDNGFELSSCHYCNMAYINVYNKSYNYSDRMDFINNASREEWREFFDEKMLPTEKLDDLIANRPYADENVFNSNRFLKQKIQRYTRLDLNRNHNHFDLDHILPKSICPIVGFSLFNFVPSCQVCNEKLKKDKELASSKEDWLKISPTNTSSSFDEDVTIKMIPKESCSTFFELQRNKKNYVLRFDTNGDTAYDGFISKFRLADRYNYHKELALNILSMKERYPYEKRKEISRLLSTTYGDDKDCRYSEKQIEADLFKEEFNKDRCFAKLRHDMLHRN